MSASTPRTKTKVLVDGGNPEETVRVKGLVGYVDGQTTNPTLIAKNPEVRTLVSSGQRFSTREELEEYKKIVQSISPLVGEAGVSSTRRSRKLLAQVRTYLINPIQVGRLALGIASGCPSSARYPRQASIQPERTMPNPR